MALRPEDVERFEQCINEGGVAIFPADTVYGLACNPDSAAAIERMYELKGRNPDKPAALMFFTLAAALEALPDLGELTEQAVRRLLPGPFTVLVDNDSGAFALATAGRKLGFRVPRLEGTLAPLASARVTVLQTSANLTGSGDARRLAEIPESIRNGADVLLDGGQLSGTPSTVVDLGDYERDGSWEIVREAAVGREQVADLLASAR